MGIKIVSENRKARFDFHILDRYEAGLELRGSEVKALRLGQCQLKDSYVDFHNNELFLINMHISEYKWSSYNNHAPERRRRLLLNRSEINKLYTAMKEKGFTCVPLKLYFKEGWAKVEIALAKGKKSFDKRDDIKKRDVSRNLAQTMRRSR
jgi:SsrA-binding protein